MSVLRKVGLQGKGAVSVPWLHLWLEFTPGSDLSETNTLYRCSPALKRATVNLKLIRLQLGNACRKEYLKHLGC